MRATRRQRRRAINTRPQSPVPHRPTAPATTHHHPISQPYSLAPPCLPASLRSPFALAVSGMRLSLQLMAFNGIPVVFVFVSAFPALLLLPITLPSFSFSPSVHLLEDLEQISKSISCVNFVSVFKRFRFSLARLTAALSSFVYIYI